MKLRRLVLISGAALFGVVIVPISPVKAVDIPTDALDFAINVNPPSATDLAPDCGDPTSAIQSAITSGQTTVSLTCSINNPSQAITGTASNARLAQTDAGFNNGTYSASCRIQQQITNTMTISGTFPSISIDIASMSGAGLQVCSFSLAFQDADKSTLTGTIELNASINGDPSTFATNKTISLSFSAKVFITNGTGAFSGYVGAGTFDQSQTIDLNQQFGSMSTDRGSSGGATPPPTDQAAQQMFCDQRNIVPCTQEKIAEYCATNSCVAPSSVRTASVRKTATSSKMSLTLKKGAGQVRIAAPTPAVGKTKATVKSTTKISLIATPKAVCTVTTNTGKVVGKATANKSGKATVKPAANAYKGAKSVRATCTLNKKTFKSAALKIFAK